MFVLLDILPRLELLETPSVLLVLSVRLEHRSPLQETQHLVHHALLARIKSRLARLHVLSALQARLVLRLELQVHRLVLL